MRRKGKFVIAGCASLLAISLAAVSTARVGNILLAENQQQQPHLYHWGFEDVKTRGQHFLEYCSGESAYTSTDLMQEVVDGPAQNDHAVLFSGRNNGTTTVYGSHFILNPQNLGTKYKVKATFMMVSGNTAVAEQHVVSVCAFDGSDKMQGGWRFLVNSGTRKIWLGYHTGDATSTANVNTTAYIDFDAWYTAEITVDGSNISLSLKTYDGMTTVATGSKNNMTINAGWTPSIQFAGGMKFNDDKETTKTANFHAFLGKISDITIDSI